MLDLIPDNLTTILFLCLLTFLAGFIDSIAGGGGLISLPAYLSAGFPPHLAIATNKFSSASGTFVAFLRFVRIGRIHWKSALASTLGALPGSWLGARLALAVDEAFLRYIPAGLLPVIAVIVTARKKFGETDTSGDVPIRRMLFLSIAVGLVIGTYDGFFGPGTGTFLILAYTGLMGFNLATASGNTKVVNLASNLGALVTFILMGKVVYSAGIPAALTGILGNWLGSGLAIRNGARVIRPVFIFVVGLLFVKILYDLIA